MWPNLQFPADLVTLTEEILNRKLHFLYSVKSVSGSILQSISFALLLPFFWCDCHALDFRLSSEYHLKPVTTVSAPTDCWSTNYWSKFCCWRHLILIHNGLVKIWLIMYMTWMAMHSLLYGISWRTVTFASCNTRVVNSFPNHPEEHHSASLNCG